MAGNLIRSEQPLHRDIVALPDSEFTGWCFAGGSGSANRL